MIIKQGKIDNLEYRVYDSRYNMGYAASKDVAFTIKKLLNEKDEISIIFAAAPSQNELLQCLVADKTIDFRRVNAFHMDEYVGLNSNAPQAFGQFLRDRLFDKVSFKSVNIINGTADNIESECERYAALLGEAKPDIVCMGIGENGHIAFNDPHVAYFNDKKAVKVVSLDEVCRNQQVNDGCFEDISLVPTHAVTLTIPTLVSPEYVFCVVPAATKANAVYTLINGEIGEYCPCTILRKHNNAILYTDKDSASRIL
ncbi:MAG: glucosamine-6-phosphate deaminase [Clostridiales bacterium]|jgi:glucosamine-6-phosphate deaminase|nr:glucosamine-6-phosphate deaminase [Clostridiales bacterium]